MNRLKMSIVAVLCGLAPAQRPLSPPSPEGMTANTESRSTSPNVHAAWLREILDLDTGGAITAYSRLATDDTAPPLDRQIAVARLHELRRIGFGLEVDPPDLQVLPRLLQDHLRDNREAPERLAATIEAELEAGRGDAAAVLDFFKKAEETELRPLVLATVLAARERPNRRPRRYYAPWIDHPARVLDRIRANDIVRAEINGDREKSGRLREKAFPNWEPQDWPDDKDAAWQQVSENLREWRNQRQLKPAERDLLRRLQAMLQSAARRGPEQALDHLDRMPLYLERLRTGLDR